MSVFCHRDEQSGLKVRRGELKVRIGVIVNPP